MDGPAYGVIYIRISSEERFEQQFNSLTGSAKPATPISAASSRALSVDRAPLLTFSGGNLKRPELQRLLRGSGPVASF
jgi:hypothetical protein